MSLFLKLFRCFQIILSVCHVTYVYLWHFRDIYSYLNDMKYVYKQMTKYLNNSNYLFIMYIYHLLSFYFWIERESSLAFASTVFFVITIFFLILKRRALAEFSSTSGFGVVAWSLSNHNHHSFPTDSWTRNYLSPIPPGTPTTVFQHILKFYHLQEWVQTDLNQSAYM